ncbi:MAG: hypothetical protein V3V08_15660 [Nannocystaceae bacterium]
MPDVIIRDQLTAHMKARIDPTGRGRIVLWNVDTAREIPEGGTFGFELNHEYLCKKDQEATSVKIAFSSRDPHYTLYGLQSDGKALVHFTMPGCDHANPQGSNYEGDVWGEFDIPVPKRPTPCEPGRAMTRGYFLLLAVRNENADPTMPQAILFDPCSTCTKEWPRTI